MAAAVAGRSMVYFTFNDTNLRDSIADMYWHLVNLDIDIGLYNLNYYFSFILRILLYSFQTKTKINEFMLFQVVYLH